jgi:quercetin dioxygenase-like cupin family protein
MIHTAPEFLELTPEMKAKLDRFAEQHTGEALGGVADRVLFEDDKVRIWEMKLEPGEYSALHEHTCQYYLIILSGDLVAGVSPIGSPMDSFVGVVPEAGNTVGIPRGAIEWAWNVGEQTYHEFLVELKNH